MEQRENFGSRLGFLLVSAGCAIGIGNVWRFPFITGQYGGAAFVLLYLFFLVILGWPVMTMEFAVGRGSGKSASRGLEILSAGDGKKKWGWFKWFCIAGNYILMMYYTTVAGWMLSYVVKMARGTFAGMDVGGAGQVFSDSLASPSQQIIWMLVVTAIGFLVCARGLQNGVEKITKPMMLVLFALMVVLAVRSVTLEGAADGLAFYLIPNFKRAMEQGIWDVIFAAMGQAFFTLSLGIGSIAIFGSYIGKERSLPGYFPELLCLRCYAGCRPAADFHYASRGICKDGGRKDLGNNLLHFYVLRESFHGYRGFREYHRHDHGCHGLVQGQIRCGQCGAADPALHPLPAGL